MHLKTLILAITLFTSGSLFGQQAHMEIEDDKHNFGFVRQGEQVKINYVIKNTGNSPLIISETKVTCGCTVAEIPKSPIKPGGTDTLRVNFDTKSKIDRQDRTVTIISNADNSPTDVRFKGVVLKPKK